MKPKSPTEILYGAHTVGEALIAGRREFHSIWASPGKNTERRKAILSAAIKKNIPVHTAPHPELARIAGTQKHHGVIAKVSAYPLLSLESLIQRLLEKPSGMLVLLDSIHDPHNLGALTRTALCAGAVGMIIPKDRSSGPTPAASHVSAGSLEHMPLAAVTNLSRAMDRLKQNSIWCHGLDIQGDRSLFDIGFPKHTALVIGNEEKGLRRLIREKCDTLIKIEQASTLNSLNASVAGGITMYTFYRQQLKDELL
ncbi:23S rRNA (guanosine(2251)-2'-O)-methyltransferase RlmB [Desulfobacterales bacterium HSG17]|nr:23S rRNA (guanosine(2251)-2'-O)-methyltransferase RlmB [Desulfobacterales bacterium HSG17]